MSSTTSKHKTIWALQLSFKNRLLKFAMVPFSAMMHSANRITVSLAQVSQPIFKSKISTGATLRFLCPNPITLWRAKTLFTKEPDTIDWINRFSAEDIFFDVGANIGAYSLYAASRGLRVYSFEPEAQNYSLLNRNIEINRLQHKMLAFNFALSDRHGLDTLRVNSNDAGSALHSLGEAPGPYSAGAAAFRQGIASYSLDELIYSLGLPAPNHLKIDVDGIEPTVVVGASRLLADKNLRSLLIELDEANSSHMSLIPKIQAFGMQLVSKTACPLTNGSQFETVFNHIFSRSP